MRIGIGVTTFLRPDCLAKCIESIHKHTDMTNVTLHIADDSIERKGVAYRKNECLRALKDCDYVFLFDDDCYPIKDNWIDFFYIPNTRDFHWLFLNDKLHTYLGGNTYKECGGVFMFLTKEMVSTVGAFNEGFETWGFEHAEYSQRVYKSGFNKQPYMCLQGTENYLYSEDYSNPNHKSSITNEEKNELFKINFPKFAKGIENIYIPL
jgi:glycosyltransferase involved in cell wall biosynthesis